MSCLLCLKKKLKLIQICSKKGQTLNCSHIIAKHFWFSFSTLESSKEGICLTCWAMVEDFDRFYQSVAEAHNFLETAVTSSSISVQETFSDPISTSLISVEVNQAILNDVSFSPEVKVGENYLNLLPQIDMIENTKSNHKSKLIKKSLRIAKYSYKRMTRASTSTLADDSETEPLSVLLQTPADIMSSTDAVGEKEPIEAKIAKIDDNQPKEFHDDISVTESSHKSYSISDSDYEPEECSDIDGDYNKRSRKSNLKQKKKYDKTIADFFGKLNCSKCELSFKYFDELREHGKLAHGSTTLSIECCGRKFYARKTLSEHALLHLHPEYLKCSYPKCDRTFQENCELEKHEKSHTNSNKQAKIFHCDQCPKTFAAKNNLKSHQLVIHLPKSDYKFQCTVCEEKFPTTRRYKGHMRSAHGLENPLICEKCGKRTRNVYSLNRHMMKHSDDPWPDPVQCDICGKWLKQANSLWQHKTWVHKRVSEEKCLICHKTFSNVHYLEKHIFHKHRDERKYQCTMCDRAFKKERDLKAHTNLHTKEVVFTCELCSKAFYQKTTLLKHKKNFHSNNQVEAPDPVQCKICNAWLKTVSGLKSHIRIVHEGSVGEHRCHICGSESVNTLALKRHLKRNHGMKSNQKEISDTIEQNSEAVTELNVK